MVLGTYLIVKKINKKQNAIVQDLELQVGDIVEVSMPVKNQRAGGRNYASEIQLKNWRNLNRKNTTLNLFGRFVEDEVIEYSTKQTLV